MQSLAGPMCLTLVTLLLSAAGTMGVAGQPISCSKPSNQLARPSGCPPFPSCNACPFCPPDQKTSFRPSVPPSWHGHLNDTSLLGAGINYSYNVLDLSALGIVYIKPGVFSQLPQPLFVEEVRLEQNYLTSLEDGVLDGLQQLRFINISNNVISFVGPRVFNTADREFCLQIVDLSHNLLTYMDSWPYSDRAGTKLELFDMSHNKINSFRNTLNMSFDDIKWRFSNPCFTCSQALYDLQMNNLTTADSMLGETGLKVFHSDLNILYDLGYFNLSIAQNDWVCDCHFYEIRQSFDSNIWPSDNPKYRPLIPVCKHPHALVNQSLDKVTPELLVCNVIRACPPRCLCQKIPAKETILVNCQNAGLTSLPLELPEDKLLLSVILSGNGITDLEPRGYLKRVKRLDLRGNRLQRVSDEAVKSFQSRVEFLDLSLNDLSTLPSSLAAVAISKVNLTFNPLRCSCDLHWLPGWEEGRWNLTCSHGNRKVELASMTAVLDCSNRLVVPISVSVALLVAVVVAGVVLYRVWLRKQLPKWGFRVCRQVVPGQPPRRPEDGPDMAFDRLNDAYISLDDEDPAVRQWVIGTLLPLLENERPQMRVYLRCRNAIFGNDTADNILDGLRCSRRLLVVLSRDYCNVQKYCLFELDAWMRDCGTREATPVVLIYDDVDQKRLQTSTVLCRLVQEGRLVYRRGDRHSLVDAKFALWRN